MKEYLYKEFLGNSVMDYIIVIAAIIGAALIIQGIKKMLLKKTEVKEEKEPGQRLKYKLLTNLIRKILIPFLYLGTIYLAINSLSFGTQADKVLNVVYIIIVAWFLTRIVIISINFAIQKYLEKSKTKEEQKRVRPLLSFINLIIWVIGLLFLLDNLGFEISSVIAGLGISGIAVALAAQAILGDLFSYFVIFFDKPFEVGDFIIFDDKLGSIEEIGIKTTKIRSLSGEQIIVSNSNLTGSRVHNYKRMERRRVVFSIGVVYQTPAEKVKQIPEIIKGIILEEENTEFDRSHFKNYGDFSLNFETVYYVLTNDYTVFMDKQQNINLKIYEEFEKRGIEFAYPTQTLYMNKAGGNEPNIEYA